jgi:hypothetical protein
VDRRKDKFLSAGKGNFGPNQTCERAVTSVRVATMRHLPNSSEQFILRPRVLVAILNMYSTTLVFL